jgi:hypothetical protein
VGELTHALNWSGYALSGSRLSPAGEIENLHEFLPDSLPLRLPALDLFRSRRLERGRTLGPVQNQQLLDESCHLLGIITHLNTRPYLAGMTGGTTLNSLSEASGVSLRSAIGCKRAYLLVIFQVIPGALHTDVLLGCKLCAHLIIGSGTSFDVLAAPGFKSLFQISAL